MTMSAKRNYYAELMKASTWLRQEQSDARRIWFESHDMAHRAQFLFRFEMLLKGLVCFGNPANHPGNIVRRVPVAEKSWDVEMELLVSSLRTLCEQGRRLCNSTDCAFDFERFIDSFQTSDLLRTDIMRRSLEQDTPNQSLALMVSVLDNLLETTNTLLLSGAISYHVFSSVIALVQREIHRSLYFNPLAIFDFRSEYDAISSQVIVDILPSIDSHTAQRVTTMTQLSLFRLLHYIDIIETEDVARNGFGPLFSYLALLHSDGLAFSEFYVSGSAKWMSEGFSRGYKTLSAAHVKQQYDELNLEFVGLKSLRELLMSAGHQLRLELKKVFEHLLPSIDEVQDPDDLMTTIHLSMNAFRSFLQNTVVLIAREYQADIDGDAIFADFTSDITRSVRLRRDIWMFQKILQAFIAKANDALRTADQWVGTDTVNFIQTFVSYFRSMGYQLLRYSDYAQFDRFIMLVERLRDEDALESQHLVPIIAECEAFYHHLDTLFHNISHREELQRIDFDKHDAATTLKLFLGAT
ncbi:MAG: hypothetical protein M0R76_04130 [Proteobacteria bacterium]|nr:hypothetical protein [Pseudomonadota bacterium]